MLDYPMRTKLNLEYITCMLTHFIQIICYQQLALSNCHLKKIYLFQSVPIVFFLSLDILYMFIPQFKTMCNKNG